jgi:voltage-gated potassium channel
MNSNEYMPEVRRRVYHLFESDNPAFFAKTIRIFVGTLILANVFAVYLESHENIELAYGALLKNINLVAVIAFTIEYILRLWASAENPAYMGKSSWSARKEYACSFMGVVDLLAIVPFYIGLFLVSDLRAASALRILRLLKLVRYFRSLEIFFSVLRSQIRSLLGAVFVVFILVVLSSMLMYHVEKGSCVEDFGNATKAMWWSVVTLTSVGYGDVVPCTTIGKFLGGFIMLLGVGLVALPAAMLAGKFADELQVRREDVTQLAAKFLQDGELDTHEEKQLFERGQKEGFSQEEIEEFTARARVSFEDSRTCPKCGYTESS